MKIATLILAAGSASRMGAIKQLLPYQETSILGKVIKNVQALKPSIAVYVVLGANASAIKASLQTESVQFLENTNYKKGLSTSIVCGVKALDSYDAILVCLADQPKVDTQYFQEMIHCYQEEVTSIVASQYKTKNGVPAIFPKAFYPSLLRLEGDKGAKQLLNSELNSIKTMPPSEKLLDIDTPEDYAKLTNS